MILYYNTLNCDSIPMSNNGIYTLVHERTLLFHARTAVICSWHKFPPTLRLDGIGYIHINIIASSVAERTKH